MLLSVSAVKQMVLVVGFSFPDLREIFTGLCRRALFELLDFRFLYLSLMDKNRLWKTRWSQYAATCTNLIVVVVVVVVVGWSLDSLSVLFSH